MLVPRDQYGRGKDQGRKRRERAELKRDAEDDGRQPGSASHSDKGEPPKQHHPGRQGEILDVEDPDLVEPGGREDLGREPECGDPRAYRGAQQYHGDEGSREKPGARAKRQAARGPQVRQKSQGPHHGQRVRQPGEGQNGQRDGASGGFPCPAQGQRAQAEAQAQVEIEEAHVKHPAISQDRDERQRAPRTALGKGGDERKGAPDEDQYGDCDRDALSSARPDGAEQGGEHPVEQDVGGLAGDGEAWRVSLFNQLREPGVIEVAREVARLQTRLPETWHQHSEGSCDVSGGAALGLTGGGRGTLWGGRHLTRI